MPARTRSATANATVASEDAATTRPVTIDLTLPAAPESVLTAMAPETVAPPPRANRAKAPDEGPVAANPPDASDETCVAQRCIQLGWSMQRLYRAQPRRQALPRGLPERLPGLNGLQGNERVAIDLGQARTSLASIGRGLGWPKAQTPDLSGIATSLGLFDEDAAAEQNAKAERAAVEAYRRSVLLAHRHLLVVVSGSDALCGKAYNLGRAMAELCRPQQNAEDLRASFAPVRLAQLHQWLDDLATALPDHAGKSVIQSLGWWRDAVYLTDDSEDGERRRAMLGGVPLRAPGVWQARKPTRRRVQQARQRASLPRLGPPLARQGELWRLVLTGDKAARDLLQPEDYLTAGRRLVREGRRMLTRAVFAAPLSFFVFLALSTALCFGLISVISASNAAAGGRLAAYLLTIGGYLATVGKVVAPRLRAAATAVEGSLWSSVLDVSCAEAVTLPPIGARDRRGWSRLLLDAAAAAAGAGLGVPGDGAEPAQPQAARLANPTA